MPITNDNEYMSLSFPVNNDVKLTFNFTDPDTDAPLDLTGIDIEFWRKPGRNSADTDAEAISYTGTVDDPTTGTAVVEVPAADNSTPGVIWWRVDLVKEEDRETIQFGKLRLFPV
jgi:hypothetical protein